MKKNILILLSLIALLGVAPWSFAELAQGAKADSNSKVLGTLLDPSSKTTVLKKAAGWATEAMVINNTLDLISVEVPYAIYDWISGNRAYQVLTNLTAVNVRLWHPDFGYVFDSYITNYTIISFAIEYGRPNVVTVTYH